MAFVSVHFDNARVPKHPSALTKIPEVIYRVKLNGYSSSVKVYSQIVLSKHTKLK